MPERIRLAGLLGSFSFAGDLGRGQPMGHVLRTCRIAMRLADQMKLSAAQRGDIYYTALLVHAGCTAGVSEFAAFLASDELVAQREVCLCDPDNMGQLLGWMRRHVSPNAAAPSRGLRLLQVMLQGEKVFHDWEQGCSEVGSRIAARLGMPEDTQEALFGICEMWNGKGPRKLKTAEIPLPARVVNASMILEVFLSAYDADAARTAASTRRGKSFDPDVADAFLSLASSDPFWSEVENEDPWDAVLDLEPQPWRYSDARQLDDIAFAFADFVDLKAPNGSAHSRRTASLAEGIARRLGSSEEECDLVRRAALVHDVGLVAVPSMVLQQGGRPSEADEERVRLHTYYTERILSRSEALREIGAVAAMHHERADGRGYHKGLARSQTPLAGRIVAVAAAYDETSDQDAMGADAALERLRRESEAALDPACVRALAEELGVQMAKYQQERRSWPADLTEREVEVLRLAATGQSVKDIAGRLVISDHTARHHMESIYSKIGVSTRAAATLFAVENDILALRRG